MTVRYHRHGSRLVPDYCCQTRLERSHGEHACQTTCGSPLDQAIGDLLIENITPVALQAALAVQQELESGVQETARLRQAHVERARYEAELARRRYMRVDPDNRLVADSLEADWNQKLRALNETQQNCQRQSQADQSILGPQQRAQILALATDFPKLWRDPKTPDRERKRMIRLLIEDVTLLKTHQLTLHVRFKAGPTQTLILPLPRNSFQARAASPDVIAEIDCLLDHHNYRDIAQSLNQRGLTSGSGKPFDSLSVGLICRTRGLKSRYLRLRSQDLTLAEIAAALGVCIDTVRKWSRHGLLRVHPYTDSNACLYEHPGADPPRKSKGVKLVSRRPSLKVVDTIAQEVQYEA